MHYLQRLLGDGGRWRPCKDEWSRDAVTRVRHVLQRGRRWVVPPSGIRTRVTVRNLPTVKKYHKWKITARENFSFYFDFYFNLFYPVLSFIHCDAAVAISWLGPTGKHFLGTLTVMDLGWCRLLVVKYSVFSFIKNIYICIGKKLTWLQREILSKFS